MYCSSGDELYRNIISNYEEKQKQLLVENDELRHCLGNLQHDLNELVRGISPNSSQVQSLTNVLAIGLTRLNSYFIS